MVHPRPQQRHPGLNARGFQDLIVEKAAGDVSALHDTLKTFVQVPEALSLGEDFMLLSSARFEPGKIEVTERVGLDLILPVATMLPFERLAQWAGKFDIPLKALGGLVDHADTLAALLAGRGGAVAAKFLAKMPKFGPVLAPIAIPALAEAVKLGKSKLAEVHAQALADRDFLTAVVTQFRLDLDHGVDDVVVLPPIAQEIRSVEDGQRLIWPLLADAFAELWDLPEPPSPDEVTQGFGAG